MAEMSYLQRYLAGEHEQVWDELRALGADVRREPVLTDARAVAAETMRRVRRNCGRIAGTLRAAGYVFGVYPDGEERFTEGPLIAPTAESRAEVAALAARVGPLPLSLEAFWDEVGSVSLVGMHPSLPDMTDPLEVGPPACVLLDLDEWEGDPEREEDPGGEPSRFEAPLAADEYHKDNVSGGPPYSAHLPEPGADFPLLYERHKTDFVPYLRLAILRRGGFPGLDGRPEQSFGLVDGLIEGLEPF
jgi:hypothetical protein